MTAPLSSLSAPSAAIAEIDVQEVRALLDRGELAGLLEALPEAHFRQGHLPGARRVDHPEAAAQVAALGLPLDAPLVVYCASPTCRNSHLAAAALVRAGHRDVRVFAAGKQGWQAAGLALVHD